MEVLNLTAREAPSGADKRTLVSLDIETTCGVGCTEKCEHALDSFRNRISVLGMYSGDGSDGVALRGGSIHGVLGPEFQCRLVGHNFKFDLRTLACKGVDLREQWEDDTLLMAAVLTEKVSDEFLEWYEQERQKRNALLPRGVSHRVGSPHSLKVLAPYFLGVEPFWENPSNHDNDEYVLKDCRYTLELRDALETLLKREGSYDFYKEKLLPWTRLLLRMELRGITLDGDALSQAEREAAHQADAAEKALKELWSEHFAEYERIQQRELFASYQHKAEQAIARLKNKEKAPGTRARYLCLYQEAAKKLEPLNLGSPKQLTWLLKDQLKLDITDFDGDETTGKAVLQKLAATRPDVGEFVRYRKATKLCQAFFPSYRAMQVDGRIHTSFNPTGTRTGRLSSSGPNLQQVDRGHHHLFRARPGYKLITMDEASIEPWLILYYSSDLNLYDIHKSGRNYHNVNTSVFFDVDENTRDFKKRFILEREVGKECGLAIKYGAQTNRLMESAMKRGFVWTKKEAQYKLDRFREFYCDVFKFRDELNGVLRDGGTVTNLFGRPYRIPEPDDVHMKGMNTLIQSGASDLVVNSAHRAQAEYDKLGLDAHVLLLVHDEIVVEAREDQAEQVKAILERCMTDYVLECSLGPVKLQVEGGISDVWSKG